MKQFVLAMVALAVLVGCGDDQGGKAQKQEMMATEKNQQRLMKTNPPPELDTSLERKQLIRRLERFNVDDKISYIYLISYGRVMSYYAIKGKVSSVNSLLTTPDQVVYMRGGGNSSRHVIASPDLDGSYGSNGDAVFFFTADADIYVEWAGEYLLSDQPLTMAQEPMLTREAK